MLTIEKIKDLLFSSEQNQAYFIAEANEHHIPGDTLDKKLEFLLYEADERILQIILAPALRGCTIAHMKSDAEYAQQVRRQTIHVMGMERWNAQCHLNQGPDRQDFITAKQDFIKQLMPTALPIEAAETKELSPQESNLAQYWDLLAFDEAMQVFLERRSFFVRKYGEHQWEQLLQSATDDNDVSEPSAAKNDFVAIKTHFLSQQYDLQWHTAMAMDPQILATFEALKQQFIEKTGTRSWNTHLLLQSDALTHATDIEAKALANLFDLGFAITPITCGIQQTTMHSDTTNQQIIHMYCVDNIHWHVYGNGYYHTIGDGACLYNGFAQCFRLLLLGYPTNPAPKISLQQTEADKASVLALQKQIEQKQQPHNMTSVTAFDENEDDPHSISLSVQTAFEDMQDIRAIGKELELFNDESPITELQDLLKTKSSLLIRLIQQKRWPCPAHTTVLQGIISLEVDMSSQEKCVLLKSLLQTILNTLYLPRTHMQHMEWNEEAYRNNLNELQTIATEISASSSQEMQSLGHYILKNRFDSLHPERCAAPEKPISSSDVSYGYAINPPPPTNDFFSASLLLTGMFMMVAGLTALIMLLALIISSSTTVVGTLLLHTCLNSVATNLSAIIGWSLPNTAVAVATVASSIVTACGFTLFKDHVPSPSGQGMFAPLQWILG